LSISSTFFEVIPRSSASMRAITVQYTKSFHCGSPCRTAVANGSFEISSGRITYLAGSAVTARIPARVEASEVIPSHRPATKVFRSSSLLSMRTGLNFIPFERK